MYLFLFLVKVAIDHLVGAGGLVAHESSIADCESAMLLMLSLTHNMSIPFPCRKLSPLTPYNFNR